jgi:hypothetical protein
MTSPSGYLPKKTDLCTSKPDIRSTLGRMEFNIHATPSIKFYEKPGKKSQCQPILDQPDITLTRGETGSWPFTDPKHRTFAMLFKVEELS